MTPIPMPANDKKALRSVTSPPKLRGVTASRKLRGVTADRGEPEQRGARPWRIPPLMVIRMFVIGSVAVVASMYAIWRHYTVPLKPMITRPAVSAAAPSASTEIEIEVPAN